jgi:flagellar biosynthesis/type III secretory pathway ATPase
MIKIGYIYKQVDGTYGISDVSEEAIDLIYKEMVADLSETIGDIERGSAEAVDKAVELTKSIQKILKAKEEEVDA